MAPLSRPRRWAYQAFSSLPAPVHSLGDTVLRIQAERAVRGQPDFADSPVRLLIGPANSAGQAWQWCRAVEARLPGVSARSLGVEGRGGRSRFGYPSDILLTQPMQLRGGAAHRRRVLGATHVLSEAARPVLGNFFTGSIRDDLSILEESAIKVAYLFHGSELRDLHEHAQRYPFSPFREPWDDRFDRMQRVVERNRAFAMTLQGPLFVATPDMLDFLPAANLLPITVEVDRFITHQPVLERRRPVVLHAPTNARLKGSHAVDAVLTSLHEEDLITYRRLDGVPHAQMPRVIAECDVVVDQIVLGNAATLVAEAMSAGRLVVAHLSDPVRARMAAADDERQPPPIVEANPTTVGQVLRDVVGDRSTYQEIAHQGPDWARRNHDGRRAAGALRTFLGMKDA